VKSGLAALALGRGPMKSVRASIVRMSNAREALSRVYDTIVLLKFTFLSTMRGGAATGTHYEDTRFVGSSRIPEDRPVF